jgi:hypothetical protein
MNEQLATISFRRHRPTLVFGVILRCRGRLGHDLLEGGHDLLGLFDRDLFGRDLSGRDADIDRCRDVGTHLREVARDEVVVSLGLKQRHDVTALLLVRVAENLAVLRAARMEHAPGGRVDRAR